MRGEESPDDNDEHGDGGSAHPRWQSASHRRRTRSSRVADAGAWAPAADANVVSGGNADGGIRGSGRNEADAVMASGGDEVACDVRWFGG